MDLQILLGLLLTVLPVFELRGGLPIIVEYFVRNGVSVWPYFALVVVLNVAVIFLIFLFFDFIHESFMRLRTYRRVVGGKLAKLQKRIDKIERRMNSWGYVALTLFVAIPLPGTGAWTGSLVAWSLGLERWKSIVAIGVGVIIAGFLVLLLSLGIFSWLG